MPTRDEQRYAKLQRQRLEFQIGCEYWDNRYARLPYDWGRTTPPWEGGRSMQLSKMKDREKSRHWVEAAIRVVGRRADAR